MRTLSPAGQFGPELTAEMAVLQIAVMCDSTGEVYSVVMFMLIVYIASKCSMGILVLLEVDMDWARI